MNPGSGDSRVRDHFSDCARDVTPSGTGRKVRLLYAPLSLNTDVTDLCMAVLSDREIRQSQKKLAAEHRAEYVQRKAFWRYCAAAALGGQQVMSKVVFSKTGKGRPFLRDAPELWLSFSCCRLGMLAAWSPDHAVGVDIEDPTRELDLLAMARDFFSPAESAALEALDPANQRRAFFRLWCLKEAALKSIGEGLPFGLDAFEFELYPKPCLVGVPADFGGAGRFDHHDIVENKTTMALVVRDRRSGPGKAQPVSGISDRDAMVATSGR